MNKSALFDPKGLMKDAFSIDGINAPECRSIFLDWALGLPPDRDTGSEITLLLAHYETDQTSDHPMIQTLKAALQDPGKPRRRGGRSSRLFE